MPLIIASNMRWIYKTIDLRCLSLDLSCQNIASIIPMEMPKSLKSTLEKGKKSLTIGFLTITSLCIKIKRLNSSQISETKE